MNRQVNAIAGRLSLRPPQRHSLEILDRVTEIVPPRKGADLEGALAAICSEFPTVTDFEREFPSLCFALATGVGKTRLMGAFISYLHLAHGIKNFFVLAPNLTIYDKLITDFTPNKPKYVFKGIAEFATDAPEIITGDNYESMAGSLFADPDRCKVNIFNISKINSEVRGGKSPRIKRLSEYIGESYFDYLAGLDDLVLLMDESHRYRASAGVRAINELKPVLGLELTATPFVETPKGAEGFKNVIYDYPLANALEDGFVKEPAVVTQENFDANQFKPEQIEKIKLQDGVRLHENTKTELQTYAGQTGNQVVKPFILIIAQDTGHAKRLRELVQSEDFFEGRYKDKVIQVDSSKTGTEEGQEIIQRLLAVESPDEPTEIVIHVNMLKEGWDVTNLYTIIPLRAANARILIEQSVGRGLRLPYGMRTGVTSVDRLNIVAHDRFKEIVDEANKPGSPLRVQAVVLKADDLRKSETAILQPNLVNEIAAIQNLAERAVAEATLDTIWRDFESLPAFTSLREPEVEKQIVTAVEEAVASRQLALEGVAERPATAAIVRKTVNLLVAQMIDIPQISLVQKGEGKIEFEPFALDTSMLNYRPVEHGILIQFLRTRQRETVSESDAIPVKERMEDYIVEALREFDDVSYDDNADLLYDLAAQAIKYFRRYLSEEDARNVLVYNQPRIAELIHEQMLRHEREQAPEFDVVVRSGFVALKEGEYTKIKDEPVIDFHRTVEPKSRVPQMVFGGFKRCLYPVQKFAVDPERRLAIILDRDSIKWFKPLKGQVPVHYKIGGDESGYLLDFVAETDDHKYLLECKASDEMRDAKVQAKAHAAAEWCRHATRHAVETGGKPWSYLLIPDDLIDESKTLAGLAGVCTVPS